LRAHDLSTEKAEEVLDWLRELQRDFEDHYKSLIREGNERSTATGARGPTET
jgi:hypothetical protein